MDVNHAFVCCTTRVSDRYSRLSRGADNSGQGKLTLRLQTDWKLTTSLNLSWILSAPSEHAQPHKSLETPLVSLPYRYSAAAAIHTTTWPPNTRSPKAVDIVDMRFAALMLRRYAIRMIRLNMSVIKATLKSMMVGQSLVFFAHAVLPPIKVLRVLINFSSDMAIMTVTAMEKMAVHAREMIRSTRIRLFNFCS